jgi:hypothetical protein
VAPKSKDFVWRIETPLGYGSLGNAPATFAKNVSRRGCETVPEIVVIDDAGLGFRFDTAAQRAWPDALENTEAVEWVVLKMARPLAHGALWNKLQLPELRKKLVVVVSIDDIRRAAVRVTRGISWERTALDLADELMSNDDIKMLLDCRHLVVSTPSEGALHADMSAAREKMFRLIFDPKHIEEEWVAKNEGSVFGFTSCLTAGIVHQLAKKDGERELDLGIKSGLAAMRRLFNDGHGPADRKGPQDGLTHVAQEILNPTVVYQVAELPSPTGAAALRDSTWTIIASAEEKLRGAKQPLFGIAKGIALAGAKTLSHVPHGRFGKLLTVDRNEIEALRSLHQLITEYLRHDKGERPLSLAVFGPPGSGKSFAVKQMAKVIVGDEAKPLEFNLSQFAEPSDLIGAFHQVRDRVLKGDTPFVFWDEFDCSEYRWLQYLLAPMQDGAFQEGQVTHPIGKAVFVFAGGTSDTMGGFGPADPSDSATSEDGRRREPASEDRNEARENWERFKLRKGPDFKSRIAGFLNVLGPNQRQLRNGDGKTVDDPTDIYFPVRRALFLRTVLGLRDEDRLDIDRGVLAALLEVPRYTHGSRSFEKLILQIREGSRGGRDLDTAPRDSRIVGKEGALRRSGLPSPELLSLFVDKRPKFLKIMERNRTHPIDIEKLAKEIHHYWWERSKDPDKGWKISDELNCPYGDLKDEWKRDNRAAAVRIPEVLELAGLYVEADKAKQGSDRIVNRVIEHYVELLAEAEHDGWLEHRRRNGWTRSVERDDNRKLHPDMKPYRELDDHAKNKDRDTVTKYPDMLERAGYRIVHSPTSEPDR